MSNADNRRVGATLTRDLRGLRFPANHVKRNGLISALLQDRTTLRVLSAPHGFGKSTLAREYAARLFSEDSVMWVDAASPDFFLGLDEDSSASALSRDSFTSGLVIIDNLPWLHEERARTLSRRIDSMLYAGVEVIVTTLPSCDCLTTLQPDRMLVRADDLLVTESECVSARGIAQDGEDRALELRRWRTAKKKLFGRVPLVMWGADEHAEGTCLEMLFSENLQLSFLKCMFAMLLLGNGNLDDLVQMGIRLRSDEVAMFVCDYPLFGIDSVSGAFEVAEFELDDLRRAITKNRLEEPMLKGAVSLSDRALETLFDRGDSIRGVRILDMFSNAEHCTAWLVQRGWDLIDRGETALASTLLERCSGAVYARSRELQALHAWLVGLSGNRREACHIAERVLGLAMDIGSTLEEPDVAGITARLALAMFGENAVLERRKYQFSVQTGPVSAVDFLGSIIESCTNVEIARAFHLDPSVDDQRLEKARRPPGKQRMNALTAHFTQYADRYRDERAFRIALHLLAHVDSRRAHRLVQEIGCDAIVEMRRCGVRTFSEAALVNDMWHTGYFGLIGPVADRRDARILDGSAHMLNQLSRSCGYGDVSLAWEAPEGKMGKEAKDIELKSPVSGADTMYVRLFGGLEVSVGERYINESGWRRKSRALFSILVVNQGRDVPREELFGQMWPDVSHVHALDNFYTVWSNCISAVGDFPYIERNGEFCRIDPRFVHSDVAEFEQLTRHLLTADQDSNYLLDTFAKIELLYRGDLLPSETDIPIINAQRERYRSLFVDSMIAATECALRVKDVRIALWFARKALEVEEGREDVYRTLMKAQIAAGQRCPAIKTYLRCRDFLRDTLGLDPSIETRELYNELITTDPGLLRLDTTSFLDVGK
jgi:DNA-binding SARP family transcriptional activator